MALQADGKIVVVGDSEYNGDTDLFVLRYNEDGTLDTSFGDNGFVITDIAGGDDTARDVAVQLDEKIIVAGDADLGTGRARDFVVLRYLPSSPLAALRKDSVRQQDAEEQYLKISLTPLPVQGR